MQETRTYRPGDRVEDTTRKEQGVVTRVINTAAGVAMVYVLYQNRGTVREFIANEGTEIAGLTRLDQNFGKWKSQYEGVVDSIHAPRSGVTGLGDLREFFLTKLDRLSSDRLRELIIKAAAASEDGGREKVADVVKEILEAIADDPWLRNEKGFQEVLDFFDDLERYVDLEELNLDPEKKRKLATARSKAKLHYEDEVKARRKAYRHAKKEEWKTQNPFDPLARQKEKLREQGIGDELLDRLTPRKGKSGLRFERPISSSKSLPKLLPDVQIERTRFVDPSSVVYGLSEEEMGLHRAGFSMGLPTSLEEVKAKREELIEEVVRLRKVEIDKRPQELDSVLLPQIKKISQYDSDRAALIAEHVELTQPVKETVIVPQDPKRSDLYRKLISSFYGIDTNSLTVDDLNKLLASEELAGFVDLFSGGEGIEQAEQTLTELFGATLGRNAPPKQRLREERRQLAQLKLSNHDSVDFRIGEIEQQLKSLEEKARDLERIKSRLNPESGQYDIVADQLKTIQQKIDQTKVDYEEIKVDWETNPPHYSTPGRHRGIHDLAKGRKGVWSDAFHVSLSLDEGDLEYVSRELKDSIGGEEGRKRLIKIVAIAEGGLYLDEEEWVRIDEIKRELKKIHERLDFEVNSEKIEELRDLRERLYTERNDLFEKGKTLTTEDLEFMREISSRRLELERGKEEARLRFTEDLRARRAQMGRVKKQPGYDLPGFIERSTRALLENNQSVPADIAFGEFSTPVLRVGAEPKRLADVDQELDFLRRLKPEFAHDYIDEVNDTWEVLEEHVILVEGKYEAARVLTEEEDAFIGRAMNLWSMNLWSVEIEDKQGKVWTALISVDDNLFPNVKSDIDEDTPELKIREYYQAIREGDLEEAPELVTGFKQYSWLDDETPETSAILARNAQRRAPRIQEASNLVRRDSNYRLVGPQFFETGTVNYEDLARLVEEGELAKKSIGEILTPEKRARWDKILGPPDVEDQGRHLVEGSGLRDFFRAVYEAAENRGINITSVEEFVDSEGWHISRTFEEWSNNIETRYAGGDPTLHHDVTGAGLLRAMASVEETELVTQERAINRLLDLLDAGNVTEAIARDTRPQSGGQPYYLIERIIQNKIQEQIQGVERVVTLTEDDLIHRTAADQIALEEFFSGQSVEAKRRRDAVLHEITIDDLITELSESKAPFSHRMEAISILEGAREQRNYTIGEILGAQMSGTPSSEEISNAAATMGIVGEQLAPEMLDSSDEILEAGRASGVLGEFTDVNNIGLQPHSTTIEHADSLISSQIRSFFEHADPGGEGFLPVVSDHEVVRARVISRLNEELNSVRGQFEDTEKFESYRAWLFDNLKQGVDIEEEMPAVYADFYAKLHKGGRNSWFNKTLHAIAAEEVLPIPTLESENRQLVLRAMDLLLNRDTNPELVESLTTALEGIRVNVGGQQRMQLLDVLPNREYTTDEVADIFQRDDFVLFSGKREGKQKIEIKAGAEGELRGALYNTGNTQKVMFDVESDYLGDVTGRRNELYEAALTLGSGSKQEARTTAIIIDSGEDNRFSLLGRANKFGEVVDPKTLPYKLELIEPVKGVSAEGVLLQRVAAQIKQYAEVPDRYFAIQNLGFDYNELPERIRTVLGDNQLAEEVQLALARSIDTMYLQRLDPTAKSAALELQSLRYLSADELASGNLLAHEAGSDVIRTGRLLAGYEKELAQLETITSVFDSEGTEYRLGRSGRDTRSGQVILELISGNRIRLARGSSLEEILFNLDQDGFAATREAAKAKMRQEIRIDFGPGLGVFEGKGTQREIDFQLAAFGRNRLQELRQLDGGIDKVIEFIDRQSTLAFKYLQELNNDFTEEMFTSTKYEKAVELARGVVFTDAFREVFNPTDPTTNPDDAIFEIMEAQQRSVERQARVATELEKLQTNQIELTEAAHAHRLKAALEAEQQAVELEQKVMQELIQEEALEKTQVNPALDSPNNRHRISLQPVLGWRKPHPTITSAPSPGKAPGVSSQTLIDTLTNNPSGKKFAIAGLALLGFGLIGVGASRRERASREEQEVIHGDPVLKTKPLTIEGTGMRVNAKDYKGKNLSDIQRIINRGNDRVYTDISVTDGRRKVDPEYIEELVEGYLE